jgi:metal-responsive CopG/Arc/MetJ family transcriptional regulator
MKTAISISDEIFQKAEKAARNLGVSRSKLYSLAIEEFIEIHNPEAVTAKLNNIYGKIDSNLDDDIVQTNYDLSSRDEW